MQRVDLLLCAAAKRDGQLPTAERMRQTKKAPLSRWLREVDAWLDKFRSFSLPRLDAPARGKRNRRRQTR
jgi:hypothetical protein